jgi:hypothetical protein
VRSPVRPPVRSLGALAEGRAFASVVRVCGLSVLPTYLRRNKVGAGAGCAVVVLVCSSPPIPAPDHRLRAGYAAPPGRTAQAATRADWVRRGSLPSTAMKPTWTVSWPRCWRWPPIPAARIRGGVIRRLESRGQRSEHVGDETGGDLSAGIDGRAGDQGPRAGGLLDPGPARGLPIEGRRAGCRGRRRVRRPWRVG